VLHTAIDDLESFAWVMLWAVLHKSRNKSITEKSWLRALSGDEIDAVANQKFAIMGEKLDRKLFSEDVRQLLPQLVAWFSLANEARTKLDEFIEEHLPSSDREDFQIPPETVQKLQELCVGYYVRYLQKSVDFLARFE
jgi:hypothetical protein